MLKHKPTQHSTKTANGIERQELYNAPFNNEKPTHAQILKSITTYLQRQTNFTHRNPTKVYMKDYAH